MADAPPPPAPLRYGLYHAKLLDEPPVELCAINGVIPSLQKDTLNCAPDPPGLLAFNPLNPPAPPPPTSVAVIIQPPTGANQAVPLSEPSVKGPRPNGSRLGVKEGSDDAVATTDGSGVGLIDGDGE